MTTIAQLYHGFGMTSAQLNMRGEALHRWSKQQLYNTQNSEAMTADMLSIHLLPNQPIRSVSTIERSKSSSKIISRCTSANNGLSHVVPFKSMMDHPLGRRLFQRYLEHVYAVENMLFYNACEQLRCLEDGLIFKQLADKVYSDFIVEDALLEININAKIRERIRSQMATGVYNRDMYDDAKTHVVKLMEKDCYPRFTRTPEYKQFAREFNRHR